MDLTELVAAVRAHALAHYNDGGWDVIVECWSDADITEFVDNAQTFDGTIAAIARMVSIYADREADARNSHGEW